MRARIRTTAAAALIALALTGCGGADDGAGVASADTGASDASPAADAPQGPPDDGGLRFAQCMRENGVDMPDPEPGQPVRLQIRPGQEAAMEACQQYRPQGRGPGGGMDPQMAENMRNLAQCMRDNGVDAFPDPDPASGGLRVGPDVANDPDFAAAQELCQSKHMPDGVGARG
jgi:hypothetical protein